MLNRAQQLRERVPSTGPLAGIFIVVEQLRCKQEKGRWRGAGPHGLSEPPNSLAIPTQPYATKAPTQISCETGDSCRRSGASVTSADGNYNEYSCWGISLPRARGTTSLARSRASPGSTCCVVGSEAQSRADSWLVLRRQATCTKSSR